MDSSPKNENLMSLLLFWNIKLFSCVDVYAGSEISQISDFKNILICVPKMNEGLMGLDDMMWVINDRIFIFWVNYPFNCYS